MTRKIKDFGLPSIGSHCIADTAGTAGAKTITLNVNCEMTPADVSHLIKSLTNALAWLVDNK